MDHDQDSSLCALKDRAAEAIEEVSNRGSAAKIEVHVHLYEVHAASLYPLSSI